MRSEGDPGDRKNGVWDLSLGTEPGPKIFCRGDRTGTEVFINARGKYLRPKTAYNVGKKNPKTAQK